MVKKLSMLNLRSLYQSHRGTSLVELILGIALLSIVLTSFFSILNLSSKAAAIAEFEDELLLNARFGIEYIKEELKSIDKIIDSNKILELNNRFPQNIGFVMMKDSGAVNSTDRYNFITYYINGNNELVRVATKSLFSTYPRATDFSGYNIICKNVLSVAGTYVDMDNSLIKLNLNMGEDKSTLSLKSMLYIDVKYDF